MTVQQGETLWRQVQEALQGNLSKPTFETWIRPATCVALQGNELQLLAPNTFACGWLRKNYLTMIEAVASDLAGTPVQVTIQIQADPPPRASQGQAAVLSEPVVAMTPSSPPAAGTASWRQPVH